MRTPPRDARRLRASRATPASRPHRPPASFSARSHLARGRRWFHRARVVRRAARRASARARRASARVGAAMCARARRAGSRSIAREPRRVDRSRRSKRVERRRSRSIDRVDRAIDRHRSRGRRRASIAGSIGHRAGSYVFDIRQVYESKSVIAFCPACAFRGRPWFSGPRSVVDLGPNPAPTIGRAKRNRAVDRSRSIDRCAPHTALGEWLPTTRDGRRRANRA